MVEVGTPISLHGVAVHLNCWCICLCYLRFAPKNPEDGKIYLLVLAHPGCPGQSPESHKMVVLVVVFTHTDEHDDEDELNMMMMMMMMIMILFMICFK